MRLPQYFIDRPIFAAVLSVVITLLGVLALNRLPISEYPEVIPPSIRITAAYPGASPETVASTVAGPLEQQMTGLDGLLYMGSQSTPDGTMQLSLTFALGTDLNPVLTDVQNRIQRATPRLPEEVRRLGVTAQKSAPSMLMVVGLYSEDGKMSTLDLANFGRLRIRDQLMRVKGVNDAPVFGAGEYAMRVWLDPDRMAARGLTPSDVVGAIREQNVQIAAGSLAQQPVAAPTGFELTITTQGRLSEPAEFEAIVVRRDAAGRLTRLGDVARVELGATTYGVRSMLNNRKSVAIPIFQASGSNALEVSDGVRDVMQGLERSLPAGVKWEVIYDPTEFIRVSIKAVITTLAEAIALVVLVVILFLQSWRASIIPLIAVPVSIIGTFAVMVPLGFTINALTLFGLVLAIGIVVDDAIVVVENVERNIANGLNPRDATRQAMREVSGPILATALVLASVFIPTAFISGLTGQFYQQFALTIAISTVISAFNSLTLSPALAALLLKPHEPGRVAGGKLFGWFFAGFNRAFALAGGGYLATTRSVVRKAGIAIVCYLLLVVAGGWLFSKTPTSFIPDQDKGFLIAFAKLPDGASLDRTETVITEMGRIALADPNVERVVQFTGLSISGFVSQSNFGLMFIGLKDYTQRPGQQGHLSSVAMRINGQYAGIPDAFAMSLMPPPIQGLGMSGGFKLYLEDRGNLGIEALWGAARAVMQEAGKDPRLFQVLSYSTLGVPRVAVDVDKEKVLAQGLRLAEVYDALTGYFGQYYANDFNRFNRTYQVTVSADANFRATIADLERVKVRSGNGTMVPISSFVRVHETAGPDRVLGYNTYLALDIQGGAFPGRTGDEAKVAMEQILARSLPPGIGYEWTELTYQQDLAGNTAIYVFPMCVLLVFLVLAAFYESLVLPLAIILIVPLTILAALGGVWLMFFAGLGIADNNIMTQIGLIVLVGLACKNAILVVEFARDAEIHRGLKPYDAVMEACRLRLRPVLMTSIAFILGVLPLVLASGAGAELRRATGVVVFFGMIGVTIFGLNFTPVFYSTLRRIFHGKLHTAQDIEAAEEVQHVAELTEKATKSSGRQPSGGGPTGH
jgi:hydrophobe/amphiphile efflux-1 (HAE1) family protein